MKKNDATTQRLIEAATTLKACGITRCEDAEDDKVDLLNDFIEAVYCYAAEIVFSRYDIKELITELDSLGRDGVGSFYDKLFNMLYAVRTRGANKEERHLNNLLRVSPVCLGVYLQNTMKNGLLDRLKTKNYHFESFDVDDEKRVEKLFAEVAVPLEKGCCDPEIEDTLLALAQQDQDTFISVAFVLETGRSRNAELSARSRRDLFWEACEEYLKYGLISASSCDKLIRSINCDDKTGEEIHETAYWERVRVRSKRVGQAALRR